MDDFSDCPVRPSDFEELRQVAKHQLLLASLALEERAERLRQFRRRLDAIDGSPHAIRDLARATYCYDHEDYLVPAIVEMIGNWPHIAGAPGAGYW